MAQRRSEETPRIDGGGFVLDVVTVEAGSTTILDGVTATIPDQGITVLAGPSGSGKTSLLRLLNRLDVPTSGSVRLRGVELGDLDPTILRRRVGMVAQRPVPFVGSVADNLRVADPALSDDEIESLSELVGLAGYGSRDAVTLSGGESQRMCVARTLATRPEVILADEPTSALDTGPRRALETLARELADGSAGHSVAWIWVSHDLDQLARLADHVLALDGGRLLASGTPAELASHDEAAVRRIVTGS